MSPERFVKGESERTNPEISRFWLHALAMLDLFPLTATRDQASNHWRRFRKTFSSRRCNDFIDCHDRICEAHDQ
jgi:hypothetical protein